MKYPFQQIRKTVLFNLKQIAGYKEKEWHVERINPMHKNNICSITFSHEVSKYYKINCDNFGPIYPRNTFFIENCTTLLH